VENEEKGISDTSAQRNDKEVLLDQQAKELETEGKCVADTSEQRDDGGAGKGTVGAFGESIPRAHVVSTHPSSIPLTCEAMAPNPQQLESLPLFNEMQSVDAPQFMPHSAQSTSACIFLNLLLPDEAVLASSAYYSCYAPPTRNAKHARRRMSDVVSVKGLRGDCCRVCGKVTNPPHWGNECPENRFGLNNLSDTARRESYRHNFTDLHRRRR